MIARIRTPGGRAVMAVAAALAVSACNGEGTRPEDAGKSVFGNSVVSRRSAAVEIAPQAGPTCGGNGAHDVHTIVNCEACHACGGLFEFAPITLPGGTSTVGGTINRTAEGTTCSVACHNPLNIPGRPPIAWNAQGPLACGDCHSAGGTSSAVSSHFKEITGVPQRSDCEGCHVLGAHLSGTVQIALGDGTVVDGRTGDPLTRNAACMGCHDGEGRALAGNTPPLLTGFSDAAGDFHGTRAGSGYGGALKVPFSRGQAQLACSDCHDAHESANPYLFRASVNTEQISANVVNRAGVGAENLCERCHSGNRHQPCMDCHGFDPAPAGSGCFFCHGHRGITNFQPLLAYRHKVGSQAQAQCQHCHGSWFRPLEYTAPVITAGSVRAVVSGTSATVTWTTNESASSWVEFGVGSATRVAGRDDFVLNHSVTITGLEAGQAYSYRVRSADQYRNSVRSALQPLETAQAGAPPTPVLVDEPGELVFEDPAPATLQWGAVTAPTGNAVQYRVVVDDDPAFGSLRIDSGWISTTSYNVMLPGEMTGGGVYTWFWRVQARDSVTGATSSWSASDDFQLWPEWVF